MVSYILLENVDYKYPKGEFTLKDISVKLYGEEFTAIVGPNGSGKTTLGKLITGIFKPWSGRVTIGGIDTKYMRLSEIGNRIGYLYQNPERQIFTSSVREEISFALKLKGYPDDYIRHRVDEAIRLFNLEQLESSLPFKLSRGEKQRLVLASIFVNHPGFLVLDEPTTGLDIERKDVLSRIIDKLLKEGIGMAVISHDGQFIKRHAVRVIELSGGEIVGDTKEGV
jgi:ABC-type cobalt transport system, ATPase component